MELDAVLFEDEDSRHIRDLTRYRHSISDWCNDHVKTYDPRTEDKLLPFTLFPKQRECLDWIESRYRTPENGLIEKSRDVGITWLSCVFAVHHWLFEDGFSCGFGSRKLELVDRLGDPSCIFEKLRIILRNIPEWMLPQGFVWKQHDNYCKLMNPATGATIIGEGGDEIGRGGRNGIYFVDESAFLERPQRVEASLSATTNCRIDMSTPNGLGNAFATKRHSGLVKVFVIDWRDDPRKSKEWYAERVVMLDPVTVAQEIDRDYTASIEGICIEAKWVQAAVGFADWLRCKDITVPQGAGVVCGLDVAEFGRDKNVLTPRRGIEVLEPIEWGKLNTTQTAWKAADEAEAIGASVMNYDAVGVGAGIRGVYESAPQDGEVDPETASRKDRRLKFVSHAIISSASPTEKVWPDGKTSHERFLNLRAELWWIFRSRVEKTYEYRELGIKHAISDLVSLPNHPQLIVELSTPLSVTTNSGKTKIESKQDMRKRGVKSPNFADSCVYAFDDGAKIYTAESFANGVQAAEPKRGDIFRDRQPAGVGTFDR